MAPTPSTFASLDVGDDVVARISVDGQGAPSAAQNDLMAVSVPELRRDPPSFHRHQYNVERRIPRRRQNDSTDSPDPDSSSSRADHCSGLLRARMHARPSPRCYAAGRLLGARYPGRIRGSGSRRSWECRRGRSSSEGRDDDGLKRPGTLQCRMPCAPSSSSAVRPPPTKTRAVRGAVAVRRSPVPRLGGGGLRRQSKQLCRPDLDASSGGSVSGLSSSDTYASASSVGARISSCDAKQHEARRIACAEKKPWIDLQDTRIARLAGARSASYCLRSADARRWAPCVRASLPSPERVRAKAQAVRVPMRAMPPRVELEVAAAPRVPEARVPEAETAAKPTSCLPSCATRHLPAPRT